MSLWIILLQLWTAIPHTDLKVLHAGHWQSCDHAERILEHRVNGKLIFELHLGPDDEFAVYDHYVPCCDHDHADKSNLLAPGYKYESRMGQSWTVPKLHLWVNVVQGGGSRDECAAHAYYIRVEATR